MEYYDDIHLVIELLNWLLVCIETGMHLAVGKRQVHRLTAK